MEFLQGNTYNLPVMLSNAAGAIDNTMVSVVEFTFGTIQKLYPNEVAYSEEQGAFIVPFSQEETFQLQSPVQYQARIKFTDGSVEGTRVGCAKVYDSLSKEVL